MRKPQVEVGLKGLFQHHDSMKHAVQEITYQDSIGNSYAREPIPTF